MVIHLRCPNGHPLTAPDSKVGRSGKCPECNVRFRVPYPGESRTALESPSSGSGSELQRAPAGDPERTIEFLCPNGHRLNGPAKLAGRPGQCPHCHERFLIPTLEELGEYERQVAPPPPPKPEPEDLEPAPEELEPESELEEVEELPSVHQEEADAALPSRFDRSDVRLAEESALFSSAIHRKLPASPSNLAGLFTRLWSLKQNGQVLEVTLKSGETLCPDQVAEHATDVALLALKQEDGKLAVVAVAWDAVATVRLRGLSDLPKEWFES